MKPDCTTVFTIQYLYVINGKHLEIQCNNETREAAKYNNIYVFIYFETIIKKVERDIRRIHEIECKGIV